MSLQPSTVHPSEEKHDDPQDTSARSGGYRLHCEPRSGCLRHQHGHHDRHVRYQRHRRQGRDAQHSRRRRRRLHGSQHQLLLGWLHGAPAVEPTAVHLPGDRGPDHQGGPRPRDRPPDRGQRDQCGRQDVHDQHPPGCQVEHHPGPSGDGAGHGARREAHLQPGAAVRRPARLRRPHRRLPVVLRRVREGGQDARRHRRHTWTRPPLAGVTAKDDQTVVFTLVHPAKLLRRHAHPALVLPCPQGVRRLPSGQPRAGPAHDLRRPVQDRLVHADEEHHLHAATRRGTRRPTRSARRTSTRS